jgi:hypothetical protein
MFSSFPSTATLNWATPTGGQNRRHARKSNMAKKWNKAGLPDGFFSNQKFKFEGLRLENVDIVYGHLEYFTDRGIFYGYLVHFVYIWYIFPVLVTCTKKNLATLKLKQEDPSEEIEMNIPSKCFSSVSQFWPLSGESGRYRGISWLFHWSQSYKSWVTTPALQKIYNATYSLVHIEN